MVTMHRAENTETGPSCASPAATLNEMAAELAAAGFSGPSADPAACRATRPSAGVRSPQLRLIEPLGYLDMLSWSKARECASPIPAVLQKEAFFLGWPCVTLRTETEWVETVVGRRQLIVGLRSANADFRGRASAGWTGPPPCARGRRGAPAKSRSISVPADTAKRIVDADRRQVRRPEEVKDDRKRSTWWKWQWSESVAGARTSPATIRRFPEANLRYICDRDQKKLDALAQAVSGHDADYRIRRPAAAIPK